MIIFIISLWCLLFPGFDGFGKSPHNASKQTVIPQPQITKVHIIFMNHLDVGYSDHLVSQTGFSANVINTYFNTHFPTAIKLARQMRSLGYVEQFRYTTHAWLLSFYLHCPSNLILANIAIKCPDVNALKDMNQAIRDKDIVWHDGPMNMNYENLNAFGLNVTLNISANLNRELGVQKPIRVISLRDVPGLSRAVIRTLVENNVYGISSGVNSGSAPPVVPPLCRWLAAPRYKGETNVPEVVYMQNQYGYPDPPGPNPNNPGGISVNNCHQAPGSTETLCFMFRNDNMGPPQSIQEVLSAYEILRAEFVNAKLVVSTFEDFFTIVMKNKDMLPAVDSEMGDTWIQGGATDPKKFARFRVMQREFQFYYETGQPITSAVVDASRFLIKPGEHTYGLDSCQDSVNWRNDQFEKARINANFKAEELSWVEQRQFLDLVLNILGPNHNLTLNILKAFKELESNDEYEGEQYKMIYKRQKSETLTTRQNFEFKCYNDTHSIIVGFQDESISYLSAKDVLITPASPLGKVIYRTYNESDTAFFLKYYKTYWNTGYGKYNSTINAHPESKQWNIILKSFFRKINSPCSFMASVVAQDSRASTYYGFPDEVFIIWDINITNGEISTEVFWDKKTPTRLMEAIFFSFSPQFNSSAYQWYFSKMGEPISPYSVMLNGSQWQHTVDDSGVFVAESPGDLPIFRVIPWDTGITCPITSTYGPTVWPAPLFPINDKLTGVAFNFYNNVWDTNFIYWYPYHGVGTDKDHFFKARFTTQLVLIATEMDNGDSLRYNV